MDELVLNQAVNVDESVALPAVGALSPDSHLVAPALLKQKPPSRVGRSTQRALIPLAILLLWWVATGIARWVGEASLPSPAEVGHGFAHLVDTHVLWNSIGISLARATTGLAFGTVVGVGLGLFTGLTGIGDRVVDPVMQAMRTVPVLALLPAFIIWFGVGEAPKIILIAFATTFPLYVNTHGAVRGVDPKLKETAWIFGLSRRRTLTEVVFPAALPTILVGLRLSLGIALLALIFAEQLDANSGIGYLLSSAQNYFENNIVWDCIIMYAIWGVLSDVIVRGLQWLLVPWLRTSNVR